MRQHAAEIHAWADGAQIQVKHEGGTWADIAEPLWVSTSEYRVKPVERVVSDEMVYVPKHLWEAVTESLDRLSTDCEFVLTDVGLLNYKRVYECRDLVCLVTRFNRQVGELKGFCELSPQEHIQVNHV